MRQRFTGRSFRRAEEIKHSSQFGSDGGAASRRSDKGARFGARNAMTISLHAYSMTEGYRNQERERMAAFGA